ncbi:ABC-2 family transporter protein [Nocardioides dokdonensis FR1436]|uniref:ABC-2 family transporter protein n=1 Tax=Nocardioides dokdonensis FR1436 TaxID=1300347 RepID=A0A1A9GIF4_9ACTN|nr:ABC transporter permease [Nocardioides dokdonensis]ANH37442.1 ABC-2 family transporter protein [Nocardioides dokdonensis FR1436]
MTTVTAAPLAWRSRLLAYGRLDLRRQLRDRMGMFFAVALPAFLFVVFGLGDDEAYGSGNVALYVMISMAAYGAVSATTTVAGSAVNEQTTGWGRQLALTPIPPLTFVAVKTAVAMVVAAVPIGLVYAIGAATGARGNLVDWAASAVIVWLGSAVFALYGLAVCLVFSGQNAASIASGLVVIMAFLGNVFSPMDGLILDIGRFTPLYGYAGLARYPLSEGYLPIDAGRDSVWLLLANVSAWTVIFAALAVWGLRRRRERV